MVVLVRRIFKMCKCNCCGYIKLVILNLVLCLNCGELCVLYCVCLSCGYYNGK